MRFRAIPEWLSWYFAVLVFFSKALHYRETHFWQQRMTMWRQKQIVSGYFLVVLIVFVNFGFGLRAHHRMLESTDAATRMHSTILACNLLLESLLNAETGVRGYIITSSDSFLAPYREGTQLVWPRFGKLKAELQDQESLAFLPELSRLITAKLDYMDKTIQAMLAGDQNAGFVATRLGTGNDLMTEIRALLKKIEANQRALREQRLFERAESQRNARLTLLAGTVLTIIFIGLSFFFNHREFTTVAKVNAALEESKHLLESRVQERTEQLNQSNLELTRSNRELQDFAFVASHDLQEPLRKIQAFGDLLKQDYGNQIGAEGTDFIDRMQNASRRMESLVKDLLAFSRVTTKAQPFVPTDLNKVVQEVLTDLEVRLKQTGGQVNVTELPVLEVDPLQMRQLMQNLIGNALKFSRPGVAPVITISGKVPGVDEATQMEETTPQMCQLTVADNGIGFDEKYLDRIFTPFQRLHGKNEYEGTGMGLAICRKVVERHGGTITAKSQPGTGSVFLISLPLTHPQKEQTV